MSKTQKKQAWRTQRVSKATVSTAVFNLLESRGNKVNRKRGLNLTSAGATVLVG